MRPAPVTATTTRRDIEQAVLHAVLVVFVALVLAVALISMNNMNVLAGFVAVAAAIVARRSYEANEVRRDFRASFADTWNAAIEALLRAGLAIEEPTWYTATEGSIHAGDATVEIERMPGDIVRLRVRIGTIGTDDHRRIAALVLENVAKRVG